MAMNTWQGDTTFIDRGAREITACWLVNYLSTNKQTEYGKPLLIADYITYVQL